MNKRKILIEIYDSPKKSEGSTRMNAEQAAQTAMRTHDWSAVTDNYEGGHPIGWGCTEQDAIDDLMERLSERCDEHVWVGTGDDRVVCDECGTERY